MKGKQYELISISVLSSVQSVREPVPAADASLGEYLAPGGHLPLYVPPLPHPLCGTSACEFYKSTYPMMT